MEAECAELAEKSEDAFAVELMPRFEEFYQAWNSVRKTYEDDNCRSQSEFIEKAIEFYWGYLTADSNTNYLAPMIQSTFRVTRQLARRFHHAILQRARLQHL
jgi:predicted KAP-like P-loop ATPase